MSKPLRLVYLTNDAKLAGTERVLLSLVTHLDRSRFMPFVITMKERGDLHNRLEKMGIESYSLDMSGFQSIPRGAAILGGLLSRLQPDVLVTYLFKANVLGRSMGRWLKVPVIISGQEGMDEWRRAYHNRLDQWSAHWTQAIITNSEAVKLRYIQHTGIDPRKIRVIYNGIDLENFESRIADQAQRAGRSLRDELGLSQDVSLIGHVANFTREKDHPNLLQCLRILADRGLSFVAVLVGSGALEETIRADVEALQLQDCVRLIGYRHDVEWLYTQFDVVTLSSYEEGMPISLLEAMAARRPVVATGAGGIPEIVLHDITGRLVPIRRPDMLAHAFQSVLENSTLRDSMGAAGRRRIEEKFTMQNQVREHENLYEEMFMQRKSAASRIDSLWNT